MNVNVPDDLYEALAAVAKRNRISTDEAVRQAISWFVKEDEELWKEFRSSERAGAEALALVERLAAEDVQIPSGQIDRNCRGFSLETHRADPASLFRQAGRAGDEVERPARHPAAAGFLTRMTAVDERDAGARFRQISGGDGSGRSCSDDNDLERLHWC